MTVRRARSRTAAVVLCVTLLPLQLQAQPQPTPAGKYTPDPVTQKARNDLDKQLDANAKALTSHLDPNGKPVASSTEKGLVLVQQTYKAQLGKFLENLDGIQ